jgi:hypothetical protein
MLDRDEVLIGVTFDADQAKRYLASLEERDDLKPRERARAEDVFTDAVKAGLGPDYGKFREMLVKAKSLSSDWYVHPTCWGPFESREVRDGRMDAESNLLRSLQVVMNSLLTVWMAAKQLGIQIPRDAFDSIRECVDEAAALEFELTRSSMAEHSAS